MARFDESIVPMIRRRAQSSQDGKTARPTGALWSGAAGPAAVGTVTVKRLPVVGPRVRYAAPARGVPSPTFITFGRDASSISLRALRIEWNSSLSGDIMLFSFALSTSWILSISSRRAIGTSTTSPRLRPLNENVAGARKVPSARRVPARAFIRTRQWAPYARPVASGVSVIDLSPSGSPRSTVTAARFLARSLVQ
jgi:hypothetical protein